MKMAGTTMTVIILNDTDQMDMAEILKTIGKFKIISMLKNMIY